ncbi:hypothetical protein GFH30_04045 [Acinetobacter wanghuae]|uniref:Lipoprotein n=1 Tax=Acinetobacter wanghuae TaxID=2662362 RepID=A0A5Q0P2G9_9GAMM|nr:hypothetical protein [Acinetobacter wanghuae]MQW93342.1 hypothetical protein [Acinetobacter wanghuae]QGA10620.1 hypothetical protein GFH30_04045 [Acinetobacter wanghuae]
MKALTVLCFMLILTGCFSRDLNHAEQLLSQFHCSKIENSQMSHGGVTQYYQQSLFSSKAKAENYVQHYKDGDSELEISLTEVVEQQYELYKAACQSLGGLTSDLDD